MNYKIMILISLALSLFFVNPAIAQDETSTDVVEYTVIGTTANLRSGPGTNFGVVDAVSEGDIVLVYDEEAEVSGWLRLYREGEDDAYIADFLVERAPIKFYPVQQEPVVTLSGVGTQISDVIDLPASAYRLDAKVKDNAFILKSIAIEGDCRDDTLFNELDFDRRELNISALLISNGCSFIFESDNVDGQWDVEIRDLLDEEYLVDSVLLLETGTVVSGSGYQLTMPTALEPGIWTITANVDDSAFILRPNVLIGDCESTSVFNELDFDKSSLELSTVYRNPGEDICVIYWSTDNVEGDWEILFEKLR